MVNSRTPASSAIARLFVAAMLICVSCSGPAAETMTNWISQVVSYRFDETPSVGAGSEIISPVVSYRSDDSLAGQPIISSPASYLYYDWPGDDIASLRNSPTVSYFFQPATGSLPINLRGHVGRPDGMPVAGVTMSLFVHQTRFASTVTSASGDYEFTGVTGVYNMLASAPGYGKSARTVVVDDRTQIQDFTLNPLTPPEVVNEQKQVPTSLGEPPIGPGDSRLRIYVNGEFQNIFDAQRPSPTLPTIVLTHGWNSNPDIWATNMARQIRAKGIGTDKLNIVAWDWRVIASLFIPEEWTPSEGVALGKALIDVLGNNYQTNIHFVGHSLGTLVNAAAANYIHGYSPGYQGAASPGWNSKRTQMTLLDAAEAASDLEKLGNGTAIFNGLVLAVADPKELTIPDAGPMLGWKPALPNQFRWADNYISLVGLFQASAANVRLYPPTRNPIEQHGYPCEFYTWSVQSNLDCILGYGRAFESQFGSGGLPYSAGEDLFPGGVLYEQIDAVGKPLDLSVASRAATFVGVLERIAVRSGSKPIILAGLATAAVIDFEAAQVNDPRTAIRDQAFDFAVNGAQQNQSSIIELPDTARLALTLGPSPAAIAAAAAKKHGSQPGTDGPPSAWVPITIPADAPYIAFDFRINGNPTNDFLVFGVGESNLFSLQAKFIPTNSVSSSRLIDMSRWAGQEVELFFGLIGGTSTSAVLQIENICFYSVEAPRLDVAANGATLTLSWPTWAPGYAIESAVEVDPLTWTASPDVPVIAGKNYVIQASASEQTQFFRLARR